jgi:hypothetical protein
MTMPSATATEYLKGFNFSVELFVEPMSNIAALEALVRLGGGERRPLRTASVESKQRNRVVLVAAFTSERNPEPTLRQVFEEVSRKGSGVALVQLLSRERKPDRAFLAIFQTWSWLPFRLDAATDANAVERVVLGSVRYHEVMTRPGADSP